MVVYITSKLLYMVDASPYPVLNKNESLWYIRCTPQKASVRTTVMSLGDAAYYFLICIFVHIMIYTISLPNEREISPSHPLHG